MKKEKLQIQSGCETKKKYPGIVKFSSTTAKHVVAKCNLMTLY